MKLLFQFFFYYVFAQALIVPINQAQSNPLKLNQDSASHVELHPNQEQIEACADCHPQIVEGFKKTHMSQAMSSPKKSMILENFETKASTVIHPKTGIIYRAFIDENGTWWQEESDPKSDYKRKVKVKYLIGSGNNTRSYIGEVSGELVELPLTWYAPTKNRAGLWDMSPGYHRANHYRFSRPVKGDCLFCHNDLAKIDTKKLSGYTEQLPEGITCIRCHGDGEKHIESRLNGFEPKRGDPDPTIYNSKYESIKRQHQLCEQCHLSGEARSLLPGRSWDKYDPRTPLEDYVRIYAFPIKRQSKLELDLSFGIASHSERSKLSLCAQKSTQFTCTSCHNPHQPDTPKSYQEACLKCHKSEKHSNHKQLINSKLVQVEKANSCALVNNHSGEQKLCFECHMKQGETSDIPHVSMTDHWIRKQITEHNDATPKYENDLKSLLPPLTKENIQYEIGLLGLAYADLVRYNQRTEFIQKALRLLVEAAQSHPKWPELWSSLGELSNTLGDPLSASAAYSQYALFRPDDEYYRLKEVATLNLLGEESFAEEILNKLILTQPTSYRPVETLANLRFKQRRYKEASELYKKASDLAPYAHSPLFNHAFMRLIEGKLQEARQLVNEGIDKDGVGKEGPFYLGLVEAAEHHYDQSVSNLKEAIKRDPKYVLAHQQLARVYYEDKNYEQAIFSLKTWIQQMPNYLDAHFILAQYLDAQARYQEAYEVLFKAQKQFPRDKRLKQALKIASERLSLRDK